jgi:DNA-binding transcriptional regulator YiaG
MSREDSAPPSWTGGLVRLGARIPTITVIVVSGTLAASGTSSAEARKVWEGPYVLETRPTSAGVAGIEETTRLENVAHNAPHPTQVSSETTRHSIWELRRISGLTWEQLGDLFGVSRRSLHFWASGKPLTAANEERLLRVLGVVQSGRRRDARATRSALLQVQRGVTAFDLLAAQEFEAAARLLGEMHPARVHALRPLNKEAKARRMPLAPDELVSAEHDVIHRELSVARASRSIRTNPRGTA